MFMVLALMLVAAPAFAGPVPSKAAPDQDARTAAIESIRSVVAIDGVSQALASQGFDQEQIEQRLASLSDADLQSLAGNLDQIQAAGLTREQWTWIGIGALAALILIVAL
jgi:hypothetical protein